MKKEYVAPMIQQVLFSDVIVTSGENPVEPNHHDIVVPGLD